MFSEYESCFGWDLVTNIKYLCCFCIKSVHDMIIKFYLKRRSEMDSGIFGNEEKYNNCSQT